MNNFLVCFTAGLDCVEEIFQTFLMASSDDLNKAAGRLKEITPLPMNSMLDRESKADAVKVPAQAKVKDFYFPQFLSYHVPKHSYLIEISILGQNTHE